MLKLFLISLVMIFSGRALAMDHSDFRQEKLADHRLDENSSPYRHGMVQMAEAISGMGNVVELLKFDTECKAVRQIQPALNALEDRIRQREVTWDLPSEKDLNVDPSLRDKVMKAGACDPSFSSLLSMVGEKQRMVQKAATALLTHYEAAYQGAKRIRESIRGQNYSGCKIPPKIKKNVYEAIEGIRARHVTIKELAEGTEEKQAQPSGGDDQAVGPFGFSVYKYFVHSGPDEFAKGHEAISKALEAKRVYLEGVKADLTRVSTFSGGGQRCNSLR